MAGENTMQGLRNYQKMGKRLQIIIDLVMTVLLPALMAYSLIGEAVHEWVGIAMFLLFLLHHGINWKWHKNLFHGRYTAVRIFGTGINIVIFFLMITLMLSGMIMSRYVFAFLPIDGGMSLARTVHLMASYWFYLLTSVHLGLHGAMMMGMFRKVVGIKNPSIVRKAVLRITAVLLVIYGMYVFMKCGFPGYMLLQNEFVFFNFAEPLALFIIDYLVIMAASAVLGYYVAKLMTQHRKLSVVEKNEGRKKT